ncbi:c-type cytochrome [Colwellia sp. MSW7]|uniref:C-type cytochrome n=1 Tax=Colwellia maritima TaxID=2912588 RepID=A0ABS9X0U2_9GAMM|nr:c-type cytochrome [Colwellia maritima]MCI2283680.1 c-type cytochrome [Colwellia maritima]
MKTLTFVILVLCSGLVYSFEEASKNIHQANNKQSEDTKHWMASKTDVERKNPIKKSLESIKRGRKIYVSSCANCHGSDANGHGPAAVNLVVKPTNLREMVAFILMGIWHGKLRMAVVQCLLGKVCLEKTKFGIWSTIFNL